MQSKVLWMAVVGVLLTNSSLLASAHVLKTPPGMEKCYGIARAGRNQCGNRSHACATLAKKDYDPSEWVLVPKGTCVDKGGELDDSSDKS